MKIFPAMGVSGNQSHSLNMQHTQTLVHAARNMGMAANEFAESLKLIANAFALPVAALQAIAGEEKQDG